MEPEKEMGGAMPFGMVNKKIEWWGCCVQPDASAGRVRRPTRNDLLVESSSRVAIKRSWIRLYWRVLGKGQQLWGNGLFRLCKKKDNMASKYF